MKGLLILILISYVVGGYLWINYRGDKKKEDLGKLGEWILWIAVILSFILTSMGI